MGNRAGLNVFEFFNFHSFGNIGVVNVTRCYIVALFVDLLLGTNNFVLDQQGAETKLRECLRVVVSRNADHAVVRSLSLLDWLGQLKFTCDKLVIFGYAMLVKDNFVHSLGKINVHLIKQGGGVS